MDAIEGTHSMGVRRFLFLIIVLGMVSGETQAQSVCSGNITGANGKPMPLAHASLLTAEGASVVKRVQVSDKGAFALTVPHTGFWRLRFSGVGYVDQDLALYVPDGNPINMEVALGCYRYIPGEPPMTVFGSFNLWSIPNAISLQKNPDGTFSADIPATTDSITFRIRGFKDADGVEGVRNASYVLNPQGLYDARIKVTSGTAHVVVEPREMDKAGKHAKVSFSKGSDQTLRISAAFQEWWDGERAYFAEQLVAGMDRDRLDPTVPDWKEFTARLLRQAETEKDALVRSVASLVYVSAAMKSRKIDTAAVTRCMKNLSPTSPAWAIHPNILSYAARVASWSTRVRDKYLQTALEHNPERAVRVAVLCNEFMIAFNADQDAKAAKYYDLLKSKYGDTQAAKDVLKGHPRPDTPANEK
jgi:hypothetical protein